jgi:hypothetical protein
VDDLGFTVVSSIGDATSLNARAGSQAMSTLDGEGAVVAPKHLVGVFVADELLFAGSKRSEREAI